jgi:hydroxyacylglutathione hydrolase
MDLVAVPAFTDNYIWILHDGRAALVVDPGEAAPVQRALNERSLKLHAIVVTHHHGDHVGGIEALLPRLQRDGGGPIFGPAGESIPHRTHALRGGDGIDLLGTRFEVIDVPGHTAGHIAYFGQPAGQAPLLLCGDTLFGGGCGRLFEGTPAQMHASLSSVAHTNTHSRTSLSPSPPNPITTHCANASCCARHNAPPTSRHCHRRWRRNCKPTLFCAAASPRWSPARSSMER